MLAECRTSVHAQTYPHVEHLITLSRGSTATAVNRLAIGAAGDWLLVLGDDDLLAPRCVAEHVAALDGAAHWKQGGPAVVYARPDVPGRDPDPYHDDPPRIPATALVNRELWYNLGGYDETRERREDRDLWQRAMLAGARFVLCPVLGLWTYRLHPGSKSLR